MTQISNVEIKCTCGNLVNLELFESVNVTVSPELISKVINREINNYECKKCGQKDELFHQFLFVDLEKKIWLWCYPESLRNEEPEIKEELIQNPASSLLFKAGAPMPSFVLDMTNYCIQ